VGAELVARINEEALLSLEAPVERVTAPDVVVPLPQGEKYYYVSADRIYRAVKRTVEF
jgi:pyruvate dehydrogenase E1 component beta subunit